MNFKKTDNKHYYNPVRRAILNHQMIAPGDKVAIDMSGARTVAPCFIYWIPSLSKKN